ncbi:MAG TPA: hypothetical protein VJ993_09335 [Woeseiaceae bacterium]|nr:hypothetical protein [Woeseiaceae bacterium]
MASPLLETSHGWFRTWFRKVWKVRGGGLYALGFIVTFVILEVRSLADDVLGIGSIFSGHLFEFLISFFVDSLSNTVQAFMWPIRVVQFAPPWGAVALGAAYIGFATFLKKPIEGWLFDGEPEPEGKATKKSEA